jgi:hypothetical protein
MSRTLLALAAVAGLALPAAAQPARRGDVADAWQLQSHGHTVCRLTLSGRPTRAGPYGADIPEACREALPAGAAGWTPIPDGLALVAAYGAVLVAFERWSESLYVSSGAGAPDLQLARAPIARKER